MGFILKKSLPMQGRRRRSEGAKAFRNATPLEASIPRTCVDLACRFTSLEF